MPDYKENNPVGLIGFFESEVFGANGRTSSMARKALSSLASFLKAKNLSLDQDLPNIIRHWLVFLSINGLALKSAVAYFEAVSGLYSRAVKTGIAESTDEFRTIKALLVANDGQVWTTGPDKTLLGKLRSLTMTVIGSRPADNSLAMDMVLFSLINGCMPLSQVARLKRQELGDIDQESRAIVQRNADARRKFVFKLDQTMLTARQLSRAVNACVSDLFQRHYISMFGNPDETIQSYWAYAALSGGVSPEAVLGMLGKVPAGVPVLSLCSPAELTADEHARIAGTVARTFVVAPMRWFVMRLRPRVKFEQLDSRFTLFREEISRPELFYPREVIYRKIGRKVVAEDAPVIPDIVFFKCRETEVLPIFRVIGDLAWCYTTTGKPGDPFVSVPQRAFEAFQEAIGHFTPEYQVSPIGGIPLKEGDTVVIIGGEFQNYTATIEKIQKPQADGRTIYRLQLNDTGFEWTVSKDARQLRKAN